MICIHHSTCHGKTKKRKKINDEININDTKIQKTDDIITSNTIDDTKTNNITTVITSEIIATDTLNDQIIKFDENLVIENNKNPINNEVALYCNNDNVQQSSQFEYDITIGSSDGDEHTLDNNTILDNNIDIGINDETTVTENSIDDDRNIISTNKIIPVTLFKELHDALKIKSMVSMLVCITILCNNLTHNTFRLYFIMIIKFDVNYKP
jgi:hypothetical protein